MARTKDPIDNLTIAELDSGNRLLKADMISAIHQGTVDRWQALAIVAFLHARRADPKVRLETFRQMTPTQLNEELGIGDDDPADDDESTARGVADVDTRPDAVDALVDPVETDPTEPALASS